MSQVTFYIPDEMLLALNATPEVLASRIRLAAAVKLFEMGQLSSGAAAQLADVPKPYFLSHLAEYGVDTFDLTEEELIHDLKREFPEVPIVGGMASGFAGEDLERRGAGTEPGPAFAADQDVGAFAAGQGVVAKPAVDDRGPSPGGDDVLTASQAPVHGRRHGHVV